VKRCTSAPLPRPEPPSGLLPLPEPRRRSGRGLGETILCRGSTRQFAREPISAEEISTVLFHATRGLAADFPSGLVDLYLIVNAVDGVPGGAYCYWPSAHGLEPLKAGEFRRQAGYLCLEQALGSDASCVVFFVGDLAPIFQRYGNRGYRLANLEAGLLGGRCYLAAYAQGFGASGLTFYDREVVGFFSPHAKEKDALFVTTLGRSVKGTARATERLEITGSSPLAPSS
jgi:SagB-type dehydrogenase family enzyme